MIFMFEIVTQWKLVIASRNLVRKLLFTLYYALPYYLWFTSKPENLQALVLLIYKLNIFINGGGLLFNSI